MRRLSALLLLSGLLLALSACEDDPKPQPTPTPDAADLPDANLPDADLPDASDDAPPDAPPAEALACDPNLVTNGAPQIEAVAGWQVILDPSDGSWAVAPPHNPGAPVLAAPPACALINGAPRPALRIAQGTPYVRNLAGAFQIELESARADVAWTPLSGAPPRVVRGEGEAVGLEYDLAGDTDDTATLWFEPRDGDLGVRLATSRPDAGGGELVTLLAADEQLFGLGTQVTGMGLRGHTYPLWTQEQGIGKQTPPDLFPLNNTLEAAYAPMGFWHSSAGWSALVDHDAYSELELGSAVPDRAALRSWAAQPAFVLLRGDRPRDRVKRLTDYTGRTTQPPAWVFGPWNDAVGGPERLHAVANSLREADIPSSAIWAEDWIGGEQSPAGYRLSYAWEWDPAAYPDLPADIATLHGQGFAFLGYFNPFVPQPTRMFAEGTDGGWLIRDDSDAQITFTDPAFRPASLVDLTDPDAVAWLNAYLRTAAVTLGIDGWMADFAEWLPVNARMHDGTSGWETHNRYPLRWQQINRAALTGAHDALEGEPANNWTFFARSGWASTSGGTSGAAATMWGGDQNTDWSYDDGFPTIIPMAVHAGLGGVAIFGTDIAGYTSAIVPHTNKELFYRWASAGALHPLMRTHHGSDECGNWTFDRDPETLQHYRRWAVIHTLLYPLFQQLLTEALTTGLPIMRHPWLVEPDRPGLWTGPGYLYLLGDDLLVAPVLEQGATGRDVRLPASGWWPLFGDAPAQATPADGNTATLYAQAPATDLPLYVRPGAALLLLARPVDSFYGAADPNTTVLADVLHDLRLALYPDATGAITPLNDPALTASGTGWTTPAPDWSTATLNGAPLPPCPADSCADATTVTLSLPAGPSALVVGAATLNLDAPAPLTLTVGIGGAAWGAYANPTPLTDLDPQIPPPCEVE